MRIFVGRLKSRVSAVGISLVGIKNIRPSGSGTSRLRTTIYVLRSASFEGVSSAPRPSSRQSSAAAGFSVRKESGPRPNTAPSTTFATHRAARPVARLKERVLDLFARPARLLQLISCRQSCNSTTNNCYPHRSHYLLLKQFRVADGGYGDYQDSQMHRLSLTGCALFDCSVYNILSSTLASVVSAAALLQPMRRSFTPCNAKAPSVPRGAVTAKKSARSTPVR